jgi:hypothetical protein
MSRLTSKRVSPRRMIRVRGFVIKCWMNVPNILESSIVTRNQYTCPGSTCTFWFFVIASSSCAADRWLNPCKRPTVKGRRWFGWCNCSANAGSFCCTMSRKAACAWLPELGETQPPRQDAGAVKRRRVHRAHLSFLVISPPK